MSERVGKGAIGSVDQGSHDDEWVYSSCNMCYSSCGIRVHRVNGVVVKIEGDPDYPHNYGRVCAKGNAGIMGLYDPNRVKTPLKRTNPEKGLGVDPKWVEISWEEALSLITERLKKTRKDNPRKLGLTTFDVNSHPFVWPWAVAFGTPNIWVMASAFFCGAGLHLATYLTTASFQQQIDWEHCNYALLFGAQTGFGIGHSPNTTTQKASDARVRGMHVTVVDPVCSTAASKADEWVPIKPGTDAELALAMLNVILNELDTYDAEYIETRTNGPYLVGPDGYYIRDEESKKPLVWDSTMGVPVPYDTPGVSQMAILGEYTVQGKLAHPAFQVLKDHVKRFTPEDAANITTIPAATIRRVATEFVTAASIGSTIVIKGRRLPHRPAAVISYRGAYSHKHSAHHALAIQLLNIVVGNIYVPGGHYGINPVGPWWETKEGIDGLMVADAENQRGVPPYNFLTTVPEPPKSASLETLFPIAFARATSELMGYREPEKFGVPPLDILIHCRSNIMMTTLAPEDVAESLKRIPFQVSFANLLDETAEFADIVLPDAHYLERLDPNPNQPYTSQSPTSGYWYWGVRQPVVKPSFKAPYWAEVLIELAERAGFLEDFNRLLGSTILKRASVNLEPKKKYTLEEIADIWLRMHSEDPAKGLDWFKKNGHVKFKRKVEEEYPYLAIKQRIPLYYEHFLAAKTYLEQVFKMTNVSWDTSDYQPLMEWRPCEGFEPKPGGYDLLVVNYTLPFHNYSITPQNPWLAEISERHPYAQKVMINTETARRKGIADGAMIWLETSAGRKVKGRAKVTECVHPEVVAVGGVFGAWSKHKPIARGKGVHFNSLLSADIDHIDKVSASADACERVKVYPA